MKILKKITLLSLFTVLSLQLSAQGRFGISYNMALPMGETSDLVSKYSFRGAGVEARWEVAPEWYVGFSGSWNVFYEKKTGTFTEDTKTLSGTRYNYINAYPVNLTGFREFGEFGAFTPYAGIGVGGMKVDRRSEMGLWYTSTNKWHFGLAPEIGTLIYLGADFEILLCIRYNYAFKAGDAPATSYLGINLGILL